MESSVQKDGIKYDVFISYRHVEPDAFVAGRLQRMLEHYRIPYRIRQQTGRNGISRVFRDREELTITEDLEGNIRDALRNSDFLVVICSPMAKDSKWVNKEVETFLEWHDRSHIMAVLVDGDPETSFPGALLYEKSETVGTGEDAHTLVRTAEHLAVDATGRNKRERIKHLKSDFLRLAAAILGCRYDDLRQRHREYILRRRMMAFVFLAAAGLAFGVYSAFQAHRINEQYMASLANQSRYLSEISARLLAEGNQEKAIQVALESLPGTSSVPDRPMVPQSLYALSQATNAYHYSIPFDARCNVVRDYTLDSFVSEILDLDEGRALMALDISGNINLFDVNDEIDKVVITPADVGITDNAIRGGRFIEAGAGDSDDGQWDDVVLITDNYLCRVRPLTGETVWTCQIADNLGSEITENSYLLSPDSSTLALFDYGKKMTPKKVSFYDMADGALKNTWLTGFDFETGAFAECLSMAFDQNGQTLALCMEPLVFAEGTEKQVQNDSKGNLLFMDIDTGDITYAVRKFGKETRDTRSVCALSDGGFAAFSVSPSVCFGVGYDAPGYEITGYNSEYREIWSQKLDGTVSPYYHCGICESDLWLDALEGYIKVLMVTAGNDVLVLSSSDGEVLFERSFGAPVREICPYVDGTYAAILSNGEVYRWTLEYDQLFLHVQIDHKLESAVYDSPTDSMILFPTAENWLPVVRMIVDRDGELIDETCKPFKDRHDYDGMFHDTEKGTYTVLRLVDGDNSDLRKAVLYDPQGDAVASCEQAEGDYWNFGVAEDASVWYCVWDQGGTVGLEALKVRGGREIYQKSLQFDDTVEIPEIISVSMSIEGERLLVCATDGFLIADLADGKVIASGQYPMLDTDRGEAYGIAREDSTITADGLYAIFDLYPADTYRSGSYSDIRIYDIGQRKWAKMPGNTGTVTNTAVTGGTGIERNLARMNNFLQNVAVSVTGHSCGISTSRGIVLFEAGEKKVTAVVPFSGTGQRTFEFVGADRYLLTWGDSGILNLFDAHSGESVCSGSEVIDNVCGILRDRDEEFFGVRTDVYGQLQSRYWFGRNVSIYSLDQGHFYHYAQVCDSAVSFSGEIIINPGGSYTGYMYPVRRYHFYSPEELIDRADDIINGRRLSAEDRELYSAGS